MFAIQTKEKFMIHLKETNTNKYSFTIKLVRSFLKCYIELLNTRPSNYTQGFGNKQCNYLNLNQWISISYKELLDEGEGGE